MFTPKIFRQEDLARLQQFMRTYPFATVVVQTNQGL
ncbi:putative FMN-binding regulatory protein PaiB [Neisseria perflava]|nr:putative FMN-binding regulatory protein PaiB [Neisseria perflava]